MDTFLYYFIYIALNASETLWDLVPYVLLGTIIGEGLRYTDWTVHIVKGINRTPLLSVLFAIILGLVSPLCTYGTIPIVLQLYRAGTPVPPLVVFLISSSMMNPQLFIMTWGGIGLEFALVRVMMIVLFAAIIGIVSHLIPVSWIINKRILSRPEYDIYTHCSKPAFSWTDYISHILKSFEFVGFYIVIGVILGAMVEILVPGHLTQYFYKAGNVQSILLVSIISIPIYVCGGGAVPFVRSLIENGMSKGAAAAFFNVGSLTRLQTIMALAVVLRPLCLVLYIFILIAYSLIVGIIYR
ncbi:MAG: permease [Bacillota bacterium]